jgi:hypothetical protein
MSAEAACTAWSMIDLQLRRQCVVALLVEQDLELLRALVEALQHAVLGHIGEAEQAVAGCVVELGGVDQAAVERRHDLAAGQRVHRQAHVLVHVDGEADGAELHALDVGHLGDRLLEPAEGLRRHRPVDEGLHVEVEALVDIVEHLLAAAVVVPGQHHVRVHAVGRAGTPQRHGGVLAVPVGDHAVAAVERALGYGVEQVEGLDHGAGRQHLDLQAAAGHVVHLLGEVECVLVEDVLGRPGGLPAHGDRRLRHRNHREAGGHGTGGAGRGGGKEFATGRLRLLGIGHGLLQWECLIAGNF